MPLDKRINARLFRDPQLLYSQIFFSLFLSPASSLSWPQGQEKSPSALGARVKGLVLARAQPSPPCSLSNNNHKNNHRTSQSRFIVYYSLRFSGPLFVPSSRDSPSSRGSFMEPLKSTTIRMEEGRDRGSQESINFLSISSCIRVERERFAGIMFLEKLLITIRVN